jgi:hypothetical protein
MARIHFRVAIEVARATARDRPGNVRLLDRLHSDAIAVTMWRQRWRAESP